MPYPDARAVILRFADPAEDVILLEQGHATAAQLNAAIHTLLAEKARTQDAPVTEDMVLRVRLDHPPASFPQERRMQGHRAIVELAHATPLQARGVTGFVRSTRIRMRRGRAGDE